MSGRPHHASGPVVVRRTQSNRAIGRPRLFAPHNALITTSGAASAHKAQPQPTEHWIGSPGRAHAATSLARQAMANTTAAIPWRGWLGHRRAAKPSQYDHPTPSPFWPTHSRTTSPHLRARRPGPRADATLPTSPTVSAEAARRRRRVCPSGTERTSRRNDHLPVDLSMKCAEPSPQRPVHYLTSNIS